MQSPHSQHFSRRVYREAKKFVTSYREAKKFVKVLKKGIMPIYYLLYICGVAKERGVRGKRSFPLIYALSNSFPSCCDISATLSCKTSA